MVEHYFVHLCLVKWRPYPNEVELIRWKYGSIGRIIHIHIIRNHLNVSLILVLKLLHFMLRNLILDKINFIKTIKKPKGY